MLWLTEACFKTTSKMLLPESSGLTCDDSSTTVTQKPDDTQECPGNETPQQLSIPGVGESTRKVKAVGKASYLTEPVRPLCDQKQGCPLTQLASDPGIRARRPPWAMQPEFVPFHMAMGGVSPWSGSSELECSRRAQRNIALECTRAGLSLLFILHLSKHPLEEVWVLLLLSRVDKIVKYLSKIRKYISWTPNKQFIEYSLPHRMFHKISEIAM